MTRKAVILKRAYGKEKITIDQLNAWLESSELTQEEYNYIITE